MSQALKGLTEPPRYRFSTPEDDNESPTWSAHFPTTGDEREKFNYIGHFGNTFRSAGDPESVYNDWTTEFIIRSQQSGEYFVVGATVNSARSFNVKRQLRGEIDDVADPKPSPTLWEASNNPDGSESESDEE